MKWTLNKRGLHRRFYFYVGILPMLILTLYPFLIMLMVNSKINMPEGMFLWGWLLSLLIGFVIFVSLTLLEKFEYLENWNKPLEIEINEEGIFSKEIFIKRKFVKETKILWSEIFRVVVSKNKKRILILFKKNRKNMYWTLQMLFLDTDDEKEIKKKIIDHIIAYAEKKNIEIVNKNLHIIAPGAIYPSSLVREISENLKIEGGDV